MDGRRLRWQISAPFRLRSKNRNQQFIQRIYIMAFESGSISCRMFTMPRKLPEDVVERFAKDAAPPLETIAEGEVKGWVTGRHLLDRNITEETAYYGGYLRLSLRLAEKKVPQSLLRAECRMEELAVMAAEDKPFLKSQQRAEIRKSVHERLLPSMPPQLKAMPFICRPESRYLYASALSAKQSDQFASSLGSTLGFNVFPLTPETAAAERKKVDARDWSGTSFTPDLEDNEMESQPGREFLTWLWFVAEAQEGTIYLEEQGQVHVLIEGPLTFVHEGNGAHISVLRQGEPVNSAEARTCLLSGKKLKSAKVTFAIGEENWKVTLDADEFVLRGLTVPQSEDHLDPISRFQERMQGLEKFSDMYFGLYDVFMDLRSDSNRWKKTRDAIREWVKSRKGRS
ncbi:MAG TPA: hypothetical protein DCZ95_09610 [Verrucomicrobia bacterium]|nr:hypothetical protein [Verrucomicrobiota bacterium]